MTDIGNGIVLTNVCWHRRGPENLYKFSKTRENHRSRGKYEDRDILASILTSYGRRLRIGHNVAPGFHWAIRRVKRGITAGCTRRRFAKVNFGFAPQVTRRHIRRKRVGAATRRGESAWATPSNGTR